MLNREHIAQEYLNVVTKSYPEAGKLLSCCLIKTLKLNGIDKRYSYYLGIFYPESIGNYLLEYQPVIKEVANYMGLIEVTFFNANDLIRNPDSRMKEQNFRFWLELSWIINEFD